MAPGALDGNGIYIYQPDDPRVPFDDTLNLAQSATSIAVGTLKSRATALEAGNVLSAVGTPCVVATGWTLNTNRGRRRGGFAWIDVVFTRSGAAITVPVNGDIGNSIIATWAATWAPASGMDFPALGATTFGSAQNGNGLILTAVTPGTVIATGWVGSLAAAFPLA
jgi:hypothetical protein